jgi:hypothetical protein
MPETFIGPYEKQFTAELGFCTEDAAMVEDIMRNHVFHSTLDWQSAAELQRGAHKAWAILEADRTIFEDHYRGMRAAFEQMKAKASAS